MGSFFSLFTPKRAILGAQTRVFLPQKEKFASQPQNDVVTARVMGLDNALRLLFSAD